MKAYWTCSLLILALVGCAGTPQQGNETAVPEAERLTVATAQREIRIGMSGAEVLQSLGTPNIVSTDSERREVWVYDRVSTVSRRNSSSSGVGSLLLAMSSSALGGALPYYQGSKESSSTTQRTLTVIIKLDHDQRVRDFAYHASQF